MAAAAAGQEMRQKMALLSIVIPAYNEEAMKEAARDRGVGKREIYKDLLEQ